MAKIRFRCAAPVSVDAEWDETVLDALVRTGTPVPFFCRSGICGQCKSVLVDGEVLEIGTAPRILTQAEIDNALARLGVWRGLLGVAAAAGDIRPFVVQASAEAGR